MQMMYEIIAGELKDANIENSHPHDYLNFYCLGNREQLPNGESVSADQTSKIGDTVIIKRKINTFFRFKVSLIKSRT